MKGGQWRIQDSWTGVLSPPILFLAKITVVLNEKIDLRVVASQEYFYIDSPLSWATECYTLT